MGTHQNPYRVLFRQMTAIREFTETGMFLTHRAKELLHVFQGDDVLKEEAGRRFEDLECIDSLLLKVLEDGEVWQEMLGVLTYSVECRFKELSGDLEEE